MGRLQTLRSKFGLVDKKLIANGIPARGRVVAVRPTAIQTGMVRRFHVCEVDVDVELDGERYRATCLHPIALRELDIFRRGEEIVVVKVNPDDRTNIALDFAAEAPPNARKGMFGA
jgi:hypothetical protein